MNRVLGKVSETGLGLFSGNPIRLSIYEPIKEGVISFVNSRGETIALSPENISVGLHNTAINFPSGEKVALIEHLMSALHSMGITEATIEVDGPEIPVFDGSAMPYLLLLKELRLERTAAKVMRLKAPIKISKGLHWVEAIPSHIPRFSFKIAFPSTPIGEQSFSYEPSPLLYESEIARARTFGIVHDFRQAKEIYRGATLDNVVVVTQGKILSTLRYPNEFVRHKILDAIGDLSVYGGFILMHYRSFGGGHEMNRMLIKEMAGKLEEIKIESPQYEVMERSFARAIA